MPFRDHFRPPVSTRHSWEGLHSQWPAMLVQQLFPSLPDGFTAEPRVHLGPFFEIDIAGFEHDATDPNPETPEASGGIATALWAPPQPTSTIDVELGENYEYEVLVYDETRGRRLVAAIELVSIANKNLAKHRGMFVAKCATLLQQGVSVSIIDLVTVRRFNLYAELLDLIGGSDAAFSPDPLATYAVACRVRPVGNRSRLETWAYPLEPGQLLPTLPLWLTEDLAVALDLEASYEDTCRVLRIA